MVFCQIECLKFNRELIITHIPEKAPIAYISAQIMKSVFEVLQNSFHRSYNLRFLHIIMIELLFVR
jgi:hypothetical protein